MLWLLYCLQRIAVAGIALAIASAVRGCVDGRRLRQRLRGRLGLQRTVAGCSSIAEPPGAAQRWKTTRVTNLSAGSTAVASYPWKLREKLTYDGGSCCLMEILVGGASQLTTLTATCETRPEHGALRRGPRAKERGGVRRRMR
jgi:hypothetical protein